MLLRPPPAWWQAGAWASTRAATSAASPSAHHSVPLPAEPNRTTGVVNESAAPSGASECHWFLSGGKPHLRLGPHALFQGGNLKARKQSTGLAHQGRVGHRPTLAVVTHWEGNNPMVDSTSRLAVSTWERYCKKWRCDVLLGRHVFGNESWREWDLPPGLGWAAVRRARVVHPRKPHWAKLVMLHALSCAYDWVLWVDADAFNTNVALDVISHIIPEAAAQHQSNLIAGYAGSDYD